ncbi:MAG: hypothetical protein ACM3PZ_01250 [Bacillota bacterium]
MKNAETLKISKEKKPSKAPIAAEALLDRREEIAAWKDQIMNAKGKKQQELKNQFKQEFGKTYSTKLLERLNIELQEQNLIAQAESLINQATVDVREEAKAESAVAEIKQYKEEAENIDEERKGVVNESLRKAGEVSGLKRIMDKILKDYPYFEEKDLEKKEKKIVSEKGHANLSDDEWAVIEKAQAASKAAAVEDFDFPQADPSQSSDEESIDEEGIRRDIAEQENWEKEAVDKERNSGTKPERSHVKFTPEEWSVIEKARAGVKAESEASFPQSDPSQSGSKIDFDFDAISKDMAEQEALEKQGALRKSIKTGNEEEIRNKEASVDPVKAELAAEDNQPEEKTIEVVADPVTDQDGENKNEDIEDIFGKEVMDKFRTLGLDNEDLRTIPGIEDLDPITQMTIASSLEVMALQRAEKEKSELIAATMEGKGRIGRVFKQIANSFQQGKYEKQALHNQLGIEKNGPVLASLVRWAKEFEINGFEYENDGEKVSMVNYALPFGQMRIPEEFLIKFNVAASDLANLPKHFQYEAGALEKSGNQKKREQEYGEAQEAYGSARQKIVSILKAQGVNDYELAELTLKADGLVDMMQNLAANPDLEKEWNKMAKGSSYFKNLVSKENAQYFAAGYASKLALAGIMGAVAVPLVAAGVASLRALKRSRNELVKKDSLASTNDRPKNDLVEFRTASVKALQELVPPEFSMDPMKWVNELATEEQKDKYFDHISAIKYADEKMKSIAKKESKDVGRKMLDANELAGRLKRDVEIMDNKYRSGTYDVSALARRVRFTYDSIQNGLVSFGESTDRPLNMARLIQTLQRCDRIVRQEGDMEENQKLAEQMIAKIFERGQKKLSSNRRRYLAQSMAKGAFMGAAFALAGRAVSSLFDNIGGHSTPGTMRVPGNINLEHDAPVSETVTGNESEVLGEPAAGDVADKMADSQTQAATESPIAEGVRINQGGPSSEPSADAVRQAVEGKADSFRDSISNENLKGSDSVWRSTKQIFLDNAGKLGYKGDLNNVSALDRWAEMNANTALANSGDITDKVFEGNIVNLEKSGGEYFVSLEAGDGPEPDYLPNIEADEALAVEAEAPVGETTEGVSSLDIVQERYGVEEADIMTARGSVITADIDGKEVSINLDTDNYSYFQGDQEITGHLDGSQNIYEALGNDGGKNFEADIEPAAEPNIEQPATPPTAEEIGKYIENNRLTMSAVERREDVLAQIEKATGVNDLESLLTKKENHFLNDLIQKIDSKGFKPGGGKELQEFMDKVVKKYK